MSLDSTDITVEQLQKHLPSRSSTITQDIVDIINNSRSNPEFQGESLLSTCITYESVLKGTRYSLKEYITAVRFCAFMVSAKGKFTEAYKKAFWDRKFVQDRLDVPTDSVAYCELTNAASRYGRTKIVKDILTVSQMPLDLIFSGARYKAVGVLAHEMVEAKFAKDRITAAKELLLATKNEDKKIELEIGPSAEAVSMQDKINEQLNAFGTKQLAMLQAGVDIKNVQKTGLHLDIVEGELE